MILCHFRSIKYSFLIVLFLTIINVSAQTVSKQLSNTDGLSNNSINCILEDSEHTIWVGTWDGLNNYNGREFKTYRYNKNDKHSISNNIIRQIIEQDSIHIWIATDYGINVWNKRKQEFTNYFLGTDKKAPKQEKSFILGKTSQKKIICYVKEEGFFYFDPIDTLFKNIIVDSLHNDIKNFVIDDDDNLFILLGNGRLQVSKISSKGNSITSTQSKYIEIDEVVSNIYLSENKLIVNYQGCLKIIDKKNSYPTTIDMNKNKTVSQVIYNDGSLLISYYEGGCEKYNLKTREYSTISTISDRMSIFSIYLSSQNILWIGTDGQGLYAVYKHSSPFQTVKTNHPVRSFSEDSAGNNILVGTKGDGIKLLNKESGQLSDYLNTNNGLLSNSVYAIKKNKAGDIFIGTENEGINIVRANSKHIEKLTFPNNSPQFKAVYSICFTNNDSTLWLGTSGYGLIKISLRKTNGIYFAQYIEQYISSNKSYSLNNNIIYAIAPSIDHKYLWIGTRGGGVNRFDIENKKFSQLNDVDSNIFLTNNDVLSLLVDKNQNLWVGTSYGLNMVEFSNTHLINTEYTDQEGIANNTMHGILEGNDGNIWISTNLGISSINPNKINNYTIKDGLQNDEFADGAYFMDQNNILYFGGVSGFNYFNPSEIHLRNFQPTLGLAALKIFNTSQNIYERIENNSIRLANDESQVTFTFIAHDFINNENCEYSYRLLNLSDEWINNGNNPNIVFTKLLPGKYLLEVKCTNGDKEWSNNIYTVNIDVAYPWWLSTWAFIVYIILVIIITYVAQAVIRNRIRLSRQVLLEHIEKQHQQKIHESRLNFFTNVAHEFFTPLTLIYGPAQFLLEKADLDNSTKHYIQIIKNNSDRMQKLINELMEFRKLESGHTPLHPENIDIKMMIDYVSDNYTEIAQENKINFEIAIEHVSSIVTDRNSLEKILFNLISNAFKYTPIGGRISITSNQDITGGTLFFTIRNTGKGLTSKQMSQLFSKFRIFENSKLQNSTSTGIGLNLTKSLVELLGGTIQVTSELGVDVMFSFEIPPLQTTEKERTTENEQIESTITSASNGKINKKTDIHILLVEDERNIRQLLNDILNPYYTIEEAENGEEALAKIEQNIPDIIISDVLMPKLDGITLISKLKADQRTKHIPVISISAKNSAEDHINAYQHGADLYITKPFHPRHVLTAVENLIGKNLILKEYFNSSRSSITIKDGIELHSEDEQFLQEIISFIENNLEDETLNPNSISDFMGISKATLYRKLKDLTDKTPSEYVRYIRLEHASKLLITTKLTVAEIMFKSGFANKSYFYREFAKQYELSPKDYRNANAK